MRGDKGGIIRIKCIPCHSLKHSASCKGALYLKVWEKSWGTTRSTCPRALTSMIALIIFRESGAFGLTRAKH